MITLSFEQIREPLFARALKKLSSHAGFQPAFALKIGRMAALIRGIEAEGIAAHQVLAMTHGEKDESGNLKTPEGMAPGSFQVPEASAKEFQAQMKEVLGRGHELATTRIQVSKLEGVGLTPDEIEALLPILVDLEAVELTSPSPA